MSDRWIGFLILLATFLLHCLYQSESHITLAGFSLNLEDHSLTITHGDQVVVTGRLGLEFELTVAPDKCKKDKSEQESLENSVCVEWEDMARLNVGYTTSEDHQCYHFEWTSIGLWNSRLPLDCFNTSQVHWYGGAELHRDHWPLSEAVPLQAFVSKDVGLVNHSYGSVLETYWLSSKGVAILVHDHVPLLYGFNTTGMCFKADPHDPFYVNFDLSNQLKYTICTSANIRTTHEYMVGKYFPKPSGLPDVKMMKNPIWSTWAKYKMFIDQDKTLEFANEIVNHSFPGSQIEIDDKYTSAYGDFVFDVVKFPDPKKMTDKLHSLGFRVTSWVMPFATPDSLAFKEGLQQGYFVMDNTGVTPGLIKWWQGYGLSVDFTNPEARQWFIKRLQILRDIGLDSFKYDAGESGFLPPYFKFNTSCSNPNMYSHLYADAMYKATNSIMEVRVGYKSQHLPVFVRMMDKDSHWNIQRGLDTVIPTALLLGLIGYPYVLPDMIGGNAYSDNGTIIGGDLPERELYIRWLTLNAFLPAMQFSICPWQYDDKVTDLARNMVKLHEEFVMPYILKATKESRSKSLPIIRPLWWLEPEDPTAFTISNQFLVSDDLMVAPVIEKGATMRDIYLPRGVWKDQLRGGLITVTVKGYFIRNYTVGLYEIAYFVKDKQNERKL